MRKFTSLKAIPKSFYNGELYQEVANNWKGTGIGYLLLTIFLMTILAFFSSYMWHISDMFNNAAKVAHQLPTMTITDGHLSMEATMPITIRDPDTENVSLVINTTVKERPTGTQDISAYMTKTALYVSDMNMTRTSAIQFTDLPNGTYTPDKVAKFLEVTKYFLFFGSIVFSFVRYFLIFLLEGFIFATIGMSLAKKMQLSFDYKTLLRITYVAFTPIVALELILVTTGLNAIIPSFIYWPLAVAIPLAYVYFGLYANRKAKDLKQNPHPPIQ